MAQNPVVTQADLQHITEEVYKRNAELNVKNKTLSLLHELYKITSASLEIEGLSERLARSIAEILNFPFVAILTKTKDARHLVPRAAVSAVSAKKQLSQQQNAVVLFPKEHPMEVALKTGKQKRSANFSKIVSPFIPAETITMIQNSMPVSTTFCFPLLSGSKQLGVLVISSERKFKEFSRFERQSIANLVTVVSVAIDKVFAYDDLRAANAKLLELDELKTEFLSIASHQLRTPLSIIKGYTSLLQEGAYGKISKDADQVLHNIDVSNERLVKLVDEFLNISRIEQGRTRYYFEETDFFPIAEGIVTELKGKAAPKEITLLLHGDDSLLPITADAEKLRHCLYNFVDNAIKYSPNKAEVHVYLENERKGLRVRVLDSGVGLDEKDLKNLFQKFYRSPHVMREVQGTGLGLFVVKQFAEAHGGRVWSKSEGVGKGSEFGFWVPAEPRGKIYTKWKRERAKKAKEKT